MKKPEDEELNESDFDIDKFTWEVGDVKIEDGEEE